MIHENIIKKIVCWFTYSIFSSGNMLAFNDLMRRVRPQQEVKAIRDEVKVRKIERLGSKPSNVSWMSLFLSIFLNKK